MHDPFEQFERSRSGWLIPVVLFAVGALLTTFAMRAIIDMAEAESAAAVPEANSTNQSDVPSVPFEQDGRQPGNAADAPFQNSEAIVNP